MKLFKQNKKKNKTHTTYNMDEKVRNKLKFLLEDILKEKHSSYSFIHRELCKEYGVESLSPIHKLGYNDKEALGYAIKNDKDIIKILKIIQKSLAYKLFLLDTAPKSSKSEVRSYYKNKASEINKILKESNIGYQMTNLNFIKIDSTYSYSNIIKPTMSLTNNKLFKNANEEFLDAYIEYQNGDNKDCLVKCLKSLETTLKIIFDEKNWEYNERDRLNKLLVICFEKELIPKEMQSSFTGIRTILESGPGPIRNNYAAHGQGKEEKIVDDFLAKYMLNITGSCIMFLIECSKL